MKIETALSALASLALTAAAPAQTGGYVSISPVETYGQNIATHDGSCHSCNKHVPFVGYRSFSQQAWGEHHGEAAALRDAYFHRAFPYGLTIGDARVAPGPTFGLQFTSSYGVECFLPNEYDPTSLHISAVNPAGPVYGSGGAFAGRLIAAKLNAEFDRIGVLGLAPHSTLGEMIVVGGVDHDLRGYTVDHIIEIADQTIAGVFGHLHNHYDMERRCVDVNGDGYADVSAEELFDALRTINKNFRDGYEDRGNLAVPFCSACTQVSVYKPAPVYPKPYVKTVVYGTCHVHGDYGYGSACAYGKCSAPHGKVVFHGKKDYGHDDDHGHKKKHVSVSVNLGHVSINAGKSYATGKNTPYGQKSGKSAQGSKQPVATKGGGKVVFSNVKPQATKTTKKAQPQKSKPQKNAAAKSVAAIKTRARLAGVNPRRVLRKSKP